MSSFEYNENNGRVVFGVGSLLSLPDEISLLGCKAPLLLTTPNQAYLVENTTQLLNGQIAGAFTGAAMHTPKAVTEAALEYSQSVNADCLVSIGGGSTTGLGKALFVRTGLPHISVPTTYAGSEMTPILGETENNLKVTRRDRAIIPATVIYDANLTLTLPPALTAASGLNAMAHAGLYHTLFLSCSYVLINRCTVEALYAKDTNPIVSLFATEGIRSLAGSLPLIIANPSMDLCRSLALFGAWLCGKCLATTTVALHHKLCHVVGGSFDLPHAETHSVILPHALAYTAPNVPEVMERLSEIIPNSDGDAVQGLNRLLFELKLPSSLQELGMKEEDIDTAVDILMKESFWNPRPLERDLIRELIRRAWKGEPARVLI